MAVEHHFLATAAVERLRVPDAAAIRLLRGRDLPSLGALIARCRGHGGLGQAASVQGLLGTIVASPDRQASAWIVVRDATVLGAIGLAGVAVPSGVRWSIPFLIVDPAARRGGLGAGLVRVALGEAHARGAVTVAAETLAAWPDAAGFWRSVATLLAGEPPPTRAGRASRAAL